VNEIRSQRLLLAAERNELQVTLTQASSRQLLETVVQTYRHHSLAKGKTIVIAPYPVAFIFPTDETLLHRVLGNLLKNALEASQPGDPIELGAEERPEHFVFWCHNRQPIPPPIQLQMFQRSFSTKGPGRGIGTYSIRLLTERFLGGRVTLSSSPEAGTRIELSFPKIEKAVGSAGSTFAHREPDGVADKS
jgi:signal transduction histidine kinase